jgi:hypothetical protein
VGIPIVGRNEGVCPRVSVFVLPCDGQVFHHNIHNESVKVPYFQKLALNEKRRDRVDRIFQEATLSAKWPILPVPKDDDISTYGSQTNDYYQRKNRTIILVVSLSRGYAVA